MSPSLVPTSSSAWRLALVGAVASLPVTALLNRLPDSGATLGGGIMVVGAFVAGVAAAIRSADSDVAIDSGDAGLRAGLLGGVAGILAPTLTADGPSIEALVAWPSPLRLVGFVVVALALASMFGLAFGRIGGWVATTVTTRWSPSPS
ncbi:DUF5518 domain-containing protein [Halorussus salinus]|uniref:DUF5518 domain-containing protein n=1 Tax=Halorussus salinus TaxID=1364935 RepID=UPI001091A2FD|nr:DUF5518 domain-containing protein [Halorussus salinus]